jgi:SPOR domain
MSGSALMAPQVNLDEFERRLRTAGSPVGPQEDPLDELARLVGLDAGDAKIAQRTFAFPSKAEAPRLPAVNLLRVDEQPAQHDSVVVPLGAARPSLRGTLDGDEHVQDDQDDLAHSDAFLHESATAAAETAPPRRSRSGNVMMGVLVVVGAAGLVGAWVVKGAPGMPKMPPMIMAMGGPTKVQPPSQDTVSSPSDSASVLLKDQSGKATPVKLVSSEEQPVDLQTQVKTQVAPPPPAVIPVSVSSDPAPAAVPVPAPVVVASAAAAAALPSPVSAQTPVPLSPTRSINMAAVGAPPAPPSAAAPFPIPKSVKTISVRPDGSVISPGGETTADAGAAASAPIVPVSAPDSEALPDATTPLPAHPPVPRARPSFDADARNSAQAATPKLDLPTKLAPKSTARVAIGKTDTTVASGPAQSPEAPAKQTPNIFQAVTNAVTGQPAAAQPAPLRVASADPVTTQTTAPSVGGGGYAVQLAAPGSEKEAQSASARLQSKYAGEIGGMQPSIRQAEVNGRDIWRVRFSGLSKADAVSLCMKLKASGGEAACFIAKD